MISKWWKTGLLQALPHFDMTIADITVVLMVDVLLWLTFCGSIGSHGSCGSGTSGDSSCGVCCSSCVVVVWQHDVQQ